MFAALGVDLTPQIAEALYTALVTDTGRFQYANTTPKALRLAADLVEAGADAHKVFQGVYESVQFAKLKLLARALERAEVHEGGAVVVTHLVRSDFAEVGAEEPYSEGIIDYLRAVEGAELVALIREPPRDGGPTRKVSLALVARRARRVADRPQVGWRRSPAGGGVRQRPARAGARRVHRRRVPGADGGAGRRVAARRAVMAIPRALEPTGVILVDKPAGPSSFAARRRRAPADGCPHGSCRHARPVRDRAAASVVRTGN